MRGTILAAAIGVVATAVSLAAATGPAAGTRACPLHDRAAPTSTRPGAEATLVPQGARALLICRYSGLSEPPHSQPAFTLTAAAGVDDPSVVSRIASDLDAIPPSSGAFSCPADNGEEVVASFIYPRGPANPVTIGLSGCQAVSNGSVHRLGLGAEVVTQIAEMARPATLRGRIRVCGGPMPAPCRTETVTSCGPSGCLKTDRVAILLADGRRLATVRLRRARFSLLVPAGRYRLELLGDGRRARGRVLQSVRARTRAGQPTSVVFGVSVP